MKEKIRKAVELAGGQAALAKAIHVSQPRVWNWIHRDHHVPAKYVLPICQAIDFKLQPSDLRPDVFADLEKKPLTKETE